MTPAVERDLRMFLAWCDEFVGEVEDHSGHSLMDDFTQFTGELRASLPSTPPRIFPLPVVRKPVSPCEEHGHRCTYHMGSDVCAICGWSR